MTSPFHNIHILFIYFLHLNDISWHILSSLPLTANPFHNIHTQFIFNISDISWCVLSSLTLMANPFANIHFSQSLLSPLCDPCYWALCWALAWHLQTWWDLNVFPQRSHEYLSNQYEHICSGRKLLSSFWKSCCTGCERLFCTQIVQVLKCLLVFQFCHYGIFFGAFSI